MNKIFNKTTLTLALMTVAVVPQWASAETTTATGAGPLSAAARVDMAIVIPRFLQFQVGTAGATIDAVTFTVAAANVGNSTPVAGTGGNVGGGAVTVNVRANTGQVTITPSTTATGLANGAGQFINFNQISTASTDAANVPAPALVNGAGVGVNTVLSAAPVTNRTATWTYSYLNTTIPSPGTYGSTVANGGRVTYTASTP